MPISGAQRGSIRTIPEEVWSFTNIWITSAMLPCSKSTAGLYEHCHRFRDSWLYSPRICSRRCIQPTTDVDHACNFIVTLRKMCDDAMYGEYGDICRFHSVVAPNSSSTSFSLQLAQQWTEGGLEIFQKPWSLLNEITIRTLGSLLLPACVKL